MPNPENLIGKGFDKNPQNINRKGQPISIKKHLKEILSKNGELPIPAENLIKKAEINGKEYYIFKIPTQNALATRLVTLAMSKNSNGFNALKLLLETFDGKAQQTFDINTEDKQKVADLFPEEIKKIANGKANK